MLCFVQASFKAVFAGAKLVQDWEIWK